MSFESYRDFLAAAEEKGLLHRVSKFVDASWEPGCMLKWMFQSLPNEDRFGMLFDNVEGSEFSLVGGAIGASSRSYAFALGVEPENLNQKWVDALNNQLEPKVVEHGVCQEVVKTGDDIKLSELPIPVWTPGKDVAPYITTATVTRHRETGKQNQGIYRTMVRDENHVLANMNPGRQGYMQCCTYLDKGEPAPVAWVIGADPAYQIASVCNLPYGAEEVTVAGGLKGAPVELVKCVTSDIFVPANAEMIIEGVMLPDEFEEEGPFGEFAGYMSPVEMKPVVKITAITHRENAIFHGYSSQMPPSESTVMQSLSNAGVLLKSLQCDYGEHAVKDAYIDLTFGGLLAHCIVAVDCKVPGDAKRIGRLIADSSLVKRVTVVDSFIDIRDPQHMDWAMNSHYNPATDTVIIDDFFSPMHMDPSLSGKGQGSKVVIDATRPVTRSTISLPINELMTRALESWKVSGLPEFKVPKRAENLLSLTDDYVELHKGRG